MWRGLAGAGRSNAKGGVAARWWVLVAPLALGCGHEPEVADGVGLLGDWWLDGGTKTRDCGSGPVTTNLDHPHTIRIARGTTSDLTLQFFQGSGTDGPVTCEFPFRGLSPMAAALVAPHSCNDGAGGVVTWLESKAFIPNWGVEVDTHLIDAEGCTSDVQAGYL